MKRALFFIVLLGVAVSPVMAQKAQDRAKVPPKQYRLAEFYEYSGSISSDGRYLAYIALDMGVSEDHLFVLDLQTKKRRQLTHGEGQGVDEVIMAPDGRQIAYEWFNEDGSHELRIIGVDGSGPRVLYHDPDIRRITPLDWSPSGKHILGALWRKDGTYQIVFFLVADGSVRVLKTYDRLPQFAWEGRMRVSPDGRYIAYDLLAQGSPQRDIWILSIEEGRELPVVENPANDLLLDWTPDGKGILFASDRRGTLDAWLIEIAEGKLRGSPVLVKTNLGSVTEAVGFTDDGSYYYGVADWQNDVYLAEFDATSSKLETPKKLVDHVGWDTAVEWSRDGEKVAYASGAGAAHDPFVLRIRSVKTGRERNFKLKALARLGGHAFQPRWSPDGRFVLAQGRDRSYTGSCDDSRGLYRIDARTGEVAPILRTEGACPENRVEWPVWPADGKVIFARWIRGPQSIVAREIETGREKELYRAISPARVSHFAVSPDGQRLAFIEWDLGTAALKVLPVSGGEAHDLVKLAGLALSGYGQPRADVAWLPDSLHLIYATSTRGQKEKTQFWRIPADGGEPQNLGLTMEGLQPYGLSVHPDGRRIAFTAGTPPRSEVWVLKNFLSAPKTPK